jgi:phosphoenolpyruvate mutase
MKLLRHLPRFRKAARALHTLAERERWSRGQIEAFQLDRLNALWQHAIAHVPYYRQLAAAAHLPARFDSLEAYQASMPILPRATIQANPRAFLSERAAPGRWVCTGGSTGTPLNAYWGRSAHLEMLQARYRLHDAWGVDVFDRTAFLWGHSASFQRGLAGTMAWLRQPVEDWLRNRIRLSAYHLGRDDLRDYLRRIAAFRPAAMYGYSRAVYMLACEAEASHFHCDSLKLITLTGEPAHDHLSETIERAFKVPAVAEYGSVECGFLAGEGVDRSLRVREDLVLMETLPRDDGRHDIVVSVLNNPSFPLFRYAIADVTDARLKLPEQGFAVLHDIAGRDNDLILTRSGRPLHSARFDALFKYGTDVIRQFRVRQHADGTLTVALELNDSSASLDLSILERKIRNLVEGYPVKVETVPTLPPTLAGKHRLVLSDLDLGSKWSGARKQGSGIICNGRETTSKERERTSDGRATSVGKTTALRRMLDQPELSFLMEAHNGLSARIVEEAGFEGVWASGLSISASLGVRDSNEASWTQVLEVLEFMSDGTKIPILVDGDTGYGNFNNMRRLVRKLEQRGIAGVCIEDKVFPKTNSFLHGESQPLADIAEFCGKIKAGKDAQKSDDFVIIARVEALIAGRGMKEALRRAEAYHQAGADAILIHSAKRSADEVLAFKQEWGDRLPVVIVPTKYYVTPTDVFRKHRFSAIIWANHLMRSCIAAMQRTARRICEEQTLVGVEEQVAPLAEVFRLQGVAELEEAEKRYLPGGEEKA